MKEIIKGIIAEMREFIKNPTIGTKTECEVKLEKYLKGCMKDYADRIEVVVAKMETTTSTCKDSLQVQEAGEVINLLKDLFACCRNMQNNLHSINAQVFSVKHFLKERKLPMVEKCVENIDKATQYIYKGDKYGFFPLVDKTLERTRDYLTAKDCFGKFNDYVGFGKKETGSAED